MFRDYLDRLLGWLGAGGADDARRRRTQAQRDACAHGDDPACPYKRTGFDCNDCEIDEKTGEMRPRL